MQKSRENDHDEKNWLIETNPELTHSLELANIGIKTVVILLNSVRAKLRTDMEIGKKKSKCKF